MENILVVSKADKEWQFGVTLVKPGIPFTMPVADYNYLKGEFKLEPFTEPKTDTKKTDGK